MIKYEILLLAGIDTARMVHRRKVFGRVFRAAKNKVIQHYMETTLRFGKHKS